MSVISDYIFHLKESIDNVPGVLSETFTIDNRGDVVLYLKGEIVLADRSELHFKEYLVTIPKVKKIAYSYHYQDQEKKMIFRFDNAAHHPELENFPHHKHIGSGSQTIPSTEITLDEILKIIVSEK